MTRFVKLTHRNGEPICTIRKAWPPSKVEYYTAAIGETFAIEVMEGGAA